MEKYFPYGDCEAKNMDILTRKVLCDVTFIVGSTQERVDCHTVFLAAGSPVFQVMFGDRWRDDGNPIELPDVEPKDFRLFLEYMYANRTYFNEVSDVDSMLYLAEKYDVESLRNVCERFLENKLFHVRYEGVGVGALGVLQVADKFNLTSISNKARDFVVGNFDSLAKTSEFLELSEENLCTLLASEENSIEEIKIFQHVYRWAMLRRTREDVKVSLRDPREFFGSCLKKIRFPAMSSQDFEIVRSYKILTAEETAEILNFIELSAQDKNNFFSSKQLLYKHQPRPRVLLYDGNVYSLGRNRSHDTHPRSPTELLLKQEDWIEVYKDTFVHGLEFLGPIEKDAYYDISIVLKEYVDSKLQSTSERMTQQQFGRKGKNLRFIFDKPIAIQKSDQRKKDTFANKCVVESTITGPPTNCYHTSFIQTEYPLGLQAGVSIHWKSKTLARIWFKKSKK